MMKWIGAAVLAMIVLVVGPGRVESVAAASSLPSAVREPSTSDASTMPTDISARRHVHRYHHHYRHGYRHYHRYGYRRYYPRYYARPYDYAPYPDYAPAPLAFGFTFGFGPWW